MVLYVSIYVIWIGLKKSNGYPWIWTLDFLLDGFWAMDEFGTLPSPQIGHIRYAFLQNHNLVAIIVGGKSGEVVPLPVVVQHLAAARPTIISVSHFPPWVIVELY
jgi:hypothetical protein